MNLGRGNIEIPDPVLWSAFILLIGAMSYVFFGSLWELPYDIDDIPALRDNLEIDKDIWTIFHGVYHPSGRPVGHLFRWLGYLFWGNDIGIFHVLSVAVHTLNAILVAVLGYRLGLNTRACFLAGALFLVNITHFKAVHHIAAMEYLLAATWAISAFIALDLFLRSASFIRLAVFYLFTILAVASHVAASAMVPMAAFYSWTKSGNIRRVWPYIVPLSGLVLGLVYLLLSQLSSQRIPTTTGRAVHYLSGSNLPSVILDAVKMMLWFLAQLFAFAHALPGYLWEVYNWQLYLGGGIVIYFVLLLMKHRDSAMTHSAVWILFSLLPFVLQDEQTIRDVPGPSRYLYLASVGSSVIIAHFLAGYKKKLVKGISLAVIAAALISSYVSLKKVESLSYYTSSLRLKAEGDLGRSLEFMEKAIADGRDVLPLEDAYSSLLLTLISVDGEKAYQRTKELLLETPDSPTLRIFQILFESTEDDANWHEIELRLRGFDRDVLISSAFGNSAKSHIQSDIGRAMLSCERAIAFDQNNTQALYLYGALLVDMGKMEGLQYYIKAVDIERQYSRLGILIDGLKQKNRLEEAVDSIMAFDQTARTAATAQFLERARKALD